MSKRHVQKFNSIPIAATQPRNHNREINQLVNQPNHRQSNPLKSTKQIESVSFRIVIFSLTALKTLRVTQARKQDSSNLNFKKSLNTSVSIGGHTICHYLPDKKERPPPSSPLKSILNAKNFFLKFKLQTENIQGIRESFAKEVSLFNLWTRSQKASHKICAKMPT